MTVGQPIMNSKMAALLKQAGLRWPLVTGTVQGDLPTFEVYEECVLLREQWAPNRHVKIADCFDKTGFECFINHVHLPFDGTDGALLPCLEYATTLQKALTSLTPDRQFRVIVAFSEDDKFPGSRCTVCFHQVRPDENYLADDLEGYKSEAMLAFDVGTCGGREPSV
jgi:hypothetical protein